MSSLHATNSSTAHCRTWTAPGGISVTAERVGRVWEITDGPEHLIGRQYKQIRIARDAVQQSPDPSATLDTAYIAERLGVTAQRIRAIAQARDIKPARVVGRAFLWHASDLPRFTPNRPGRPSAPAN